MTGFPILSLMLLVPLVATATVAIFLGRRDYVGPLAYISGCLGTLIGADLLNLGQVAGLGAPMVSSEGACAAYYRYRRHDLDVKLEALV